MDCQKYYPFYWLRYTPVKIFYVLGERIKLCWSHYNRLLHFIREWMNERHKGSAGFVQWGIHRSAPLIILSILMADILSNLIVAGVIWQFDVWHIYQNKLNWQSQMVIIKEAFRRNRRHARLFFVFCCNYSV